MPGMEDQTQQQRRRDLLEGMSDMLYQDARQTTDYYVQRQWQAEELEQDLRSEHQRKTGIGNVRQAVREVMGEAYAGIDEVRRSESVDLRRSVLHHARGQQYLDQGQKVLEFDIAGSGFNQFRTEHKGFKGNNSVRINGEEVKLEKKTKVRWYHRRLSWLPRIRGLPYIRTPEEVERDNEVLRRVKEKFKEQYGESQVINGKKLKEVRRRELGNKTRISMAGPLKLGGASNRGDYKIENLREYMLTMAQDYLRNVFDTWARTGETEQNVHLIIKGHSRGGVAAAEGAMMIRDWLLKSEDYRKYADRVKFDLTQYDPVPGTGSFRDHKKVDLKATDGGRGDGSGMSGLGDSADTTVIYSVHTDHSAFFDPQIVKGAQRIILTPFKHGVGLGDIDTAETRQRPNARQQEAARQRRAAGAQRTAEEVHRHRPGYTDAATGGVYRGSGLNELDPGVYIVDEQNTLIRFENAAQVERVLGTILEKTSHQSARHKTLMEVAEHWFETHPRQYDDAGRT